MTEDDRPDGPPESLQARRSGSFSFDETYAGSPPWDIGRPQPAFQALADAGELRGRVLDVGCGTGEQALLAAGLGLDATGVDSAPTAIALAEGKAGDRGLSARFLIHDALDLAVLDEQFETVLDSGLFHVFEDDDRPRYVDSLKAVTLTGSRYFLLCFSDQQPGEFGPRRVSQGEITASFADGWRVDSIEATTMAVTFIPTGALAWLASITRL